MPEEKRQELQTGRQGQGVSSVRHHVSISDRSRLEVTGVREVRSFDEHEIILETEEGVMLINGNELHLDRLVLEKGEAAVSGQIDRLQYTGAKGAKHQESLLARLFR